MKEAKFIAKNKQRWSEIERKGPEYTDELASDFIELSDDLSYARTFYPGSPTEKYLNQLMARFQTRIYHYRSERKKGLLAFWKEDFPLLLFKERKTMLFVLLFFIVSVIVGWFSAGHEASFVRFILGDAYVNWTLDNIAAGTPMGIYNSGGEWEMFWEITLNNIRVSFIAFVFGVFFSVGALWILFSNGVMLGAFQYFFYAQGLFLHSASSIWAHGTFEITSIVIAGGAGVIIGNSFLFPGTYTRIQSFKKGALKGIQIVVGLIPFFILAGGIESFITRYADSYPAVGFGCVSLSFIGVLGYFGLYPFLVNKRKHGKN